MHVYMYVCMFVCMHLRTDVHVCVCMYIMYGQNFHIYTPRHFDHCFAVSQFRNYLSATEEYKNVSIMPALAITDTSL